MSGKKKHIGSTLESLFEELGERDDVELLANKKLLSEAFEMRMRALAVSTGKLAKLMSTSRNQVHRLLDPHETGITFKSVDRASKALGMRFTMQVVPKTVGAAGGNRSRGRTPRVAKAPSGAGASIAAAKKQRKRKAR